MTLYKQILTALSIVILCILVILYLIGLIDIPILRNIYLKIFLTIPLGLGFIFFLIGVYKKKYARRYMVFYAALFEIFGYWWIESWIGYVFIALGLFLLPIYIGDWMKRA